MILQQTIFGPRWTHPAGGFFYSIILGCTSLPPGFGGVNSCGADRANSDWFSRSFDCHLAAVSLHVAFYNLCRTHEALWMTPAMALGIPDHVWSVAELIEAGADGGPDEPDANPAQRRKSFRVIQGGLV
jgi:hypothetical protein